MILSVYVSSVPPSPPRFQVATPSRLMGFFHLASSTTFGSTSTISSTALTRRGGHFAPHEEPSLPAADITAFLRELP
ncbi:hypothetical protein [Agreia sp. COWG]|uniref:hypothetical protein n=1 Tax=Agreia sp. COWG TaxID=2773266 RepID=UPI0019291C54|nr:hypothetical protein [Agreia sp. COWG]